MFDGQTANHEFEFNLDESLTTTTSIESIVRQCCELPEVVRSAELTKIYERLMDDSELDRVTNPLSISVQDVGEIERLTKRRKILGAQLGSYLTCVVVQLPGICYTVEIDEDSRSVVHWEWKTV